MTPSWTPSYTKSITYTQSATDTPTPSITWTSTITETSTQTPQSYVMIYVRVYNEAGELGGVLTEGEVGETVIEGFDFLRGEDGDEITVIDDGNDVITVILPDGRVYYWYAMDGEVELKNGTYIIKVESVDNIGVVTTVSREVAVLRGDTRVTVKIFNEAGELVWQEEMVGDIDKLMADVTFSSDHLSPTTEENDPEGQVRIDLGGMAEVVWDGRDSEGMIVPNGEYIVEVTVNAEGEKAQKMYRTVTVLHGAPDVYDVITTWPNPLVNGEEVSVKARGEGIERVSAHIYNVAGELIRIISRPGDELVWDLTATNGKEVSAGVYVAVVEVRKAGTAEYQTVRIVVLR